jgi:hypothetical protein
MGVGQSFNNDSAKELLAAPFAQGNDPPHLTYQALLLAGPRVLAMSKNSGPRERSRDIPARTPCLGNRAMDTRPRRATWPASW